MADFLNDKDYSSYFNELNKQLEDRSKRSETSSTIAVDNPPKKKKSAFKKGIYKVIKLKRRSLIAALAAILIFSILIAVCVNSCGDDGAPNNSALNNVAQDAAKSEESVKKPISYTENEETVKIPKDNDAKTAIIIRKSDNTIIAQRNPHKKVHPASTLKIMTALVAIENVTDFDDTFTMSYEVTDPLFRAKASMAGFKNDENVTITDLLYGTILPSGADAAMGLAIKIAGSEEAFVVLMNKKAQELGLKNTHFANVTGLHHKDNYSTAYDMAIILDHAMQNPLCRKILSAVEYTTEKTAQNPDGIILQGTLFKYMYGTEPETAIIRGGKTGYINEAGYCIASFGENTEKNEEYIVVTMGNSSKWPAFHGQIALYKQFAK